MTIQQQAYGERVKRLYPLEAVYNELTVVGYEQRVYKHLKIDASR